MNPAPYKKAHNSIRRRLEESFRTKGEGQWGKLRTPIKENKKKKEKKKKKGYRRPLSHSKKSDRGGGVGGGGGGGEKGNTAIANGYQDDANRI